eukprot:1570341-Amphidinium_carterae.1
MPQMQMSGSLHLLALHARHKVALWCYILTSSFGTLVFIHVPLDLSQYRAICTRHKAEGRLKNPLATRRLCCSALKGQKVVRTRLITLHLSGAGTIDKS